MDDKRIWAAWESIHYALRDVMRSTETDVLRFLAETEGNVAVTEAAADELEDRKENV